MMNDTNMTTEQKQNLNPFSNVRHEMRETIENLLLATAIVWFPALVLGTGAVVIYSGLDVYLGLR